jgi:hypothetical protein
VIESDVRQIDEWNVQAARQATVQIGLGHGADVDENAPQLAAAAPLFLERFLQVLLRDQLFFEQ